MAEGTTINSGSQERVALELANRIWTWEQLGKNTPADVRSRFLDLYAECLRATTRNRKASST